MFLENITVKLFACFVFTYCGSYTKAFLLQSPRLTNWGTWGALEKCPTGKYVTGMQLKVETDQGLTKDDTGLNGIRFFCSNVTDNKLAVDSPITSTSSPWGFWRSVSFCSENFMFEESTTYRVAVGFRLRSEGVRGHRDDTAANNLILVCADIDPDTGNHGFLDRIEGDGTRWGDWTDEQICPTRYAICGIMTQIEHSKGRRHDDTALNNIDVECCPIYGLTNKGNQDASEITTNVELTTGTQRPPTTVTADVEIDYSSSANSEETFENDNRNAAEVTPEVVQSLTTEKSGQLTTTDDGNADEDTHEIEITQERVNSEEAEKSTERVELVQNGRTTVKPFDSDVTLKSRQEISEPRPEMKTDNYYDSQQWDTNERRKELDNGNSIRESSTTLEPQQDYGNNYEVYEDKAVENTVSGTVQTITEPDSNPRVTIVDNNIDNSPDSAQQQYDSDKGGYDYQNQDIVVNNARTLQADTFITYCLVGKLIVLLYKVIQ